MGLFSFLKNNGKSVFKKSGTESSDVKELLVKQLDGKFEKLDVVFKDGIVTLVGNCDSLATKEKAALIAGNIKGVESVDADHLHYPKPVELEVVEPEPKLYTIVSGDSLSKIAKKFYGDAMKYPALFEANREVIKDANLIYPGQVIRVPDLEN